MSSRKSPLTGADLHRAWLDFVNADGPFLAIPPLRRVWPQGMPQPRANEVAALKDARPDWEKAWERWSDDPEDAAALRHYRDARDAWVDVVLRDVLGWRNSYVLAADGQAATDVEIRSPDYVVTVRPTGALVHNGRTGALVLVIDPVDELRDPLADGWAASPIDRMEELLRKAGVPIGVVTDGRWWGIVSARPDTMVASGITDAHTWWGYGQPTRNAFIELLRRTRLLGGKPEDRLTELFKESVAAAEDITEALGTQVRRAVELLVQALSEAALAAKERGEPDPLPDDRGQVYEAAVTLMMRVVFLLFAEERGLLPQSALFTGGYGISEELDKLDDRAREETSEALDATHLTWYRLLATSEALYQGAEFEDAAIPSYGGSLFDPARFSFLTATTAHGTLAIQVSDRVMVEVLRAVQVARLRGQPARRISFRDIDVEQIGYIYEGLLGYTTEPAKTVTVGLLGKEGEEPEIPLTKLEELTAANRTEAALANAILAWVKDDQPAAVPPTKAALAKAIREGAASAAGAGPEDAERVLRSVTTDPQLRERLRPFLGVIRRDLRDRPFVVPRGGVLVVETPSRATAGAHYTPKSLAEDVVRYALEPLVYNPGPHQRADGWVPVDSDTILELKVADIACGSGAFLVAAARYLGKRLMEAWRRQGETGGMTPGELELHAIRTVISRCLYGADINAMAIEMCKLSLWLVSLDPKLPFSFVDDKVLHGNSLLGLTDVEQIKQTHFAPADNPRFSIFDVNADEVLQQARRLRQRLASEVDDSDPQRSTHTKRRQWQQYQKVIADLTDIADAVIAAGLRLGGRPGRQLEAAYENLAIAVSDAYPPHGEGNRRVIEEILAAGLTPTVDTDYQRWKPLHWILAVPDVMERGGFDAIIGNPPFLGDTKISGALGANMRDWLVNTLAYGAKGKADLVAYFFLRAMSLLTGRGNLGLIATNSVGQGATRQVGLRQMVRHGFTITRAIQSESWPSASVNLEYAAVWGTQGSIAAGAPLIADGIPAEQISSLLEPGEDIDPIRLPENIGMVFEGCKPYGMGFILDPREANSWIDVDPRNVEVLFPCLNGDDLNSSPDTSASRWIVDFNDRPEAIAEAYRLPFERLANTVRAERARTSRAVREAPWWLFWRARPALRRAIADLDEVLVTALTSKTVMPVRVQTGQVFTNALDVFATDSFADQAVLSSSLHQMWAIRCGSGMRNDPRYTPSSVFDTLPRPKSTARLTEIGQTLDTERREIMLRRELGLTKLYNLVNDRETPAGTDPDVDRLRQIHVELDHAVMDAYGWADVELDHGFHTYRRMTRWTVSPAARVEIFDRLLAENHRRAAAQGEAPPPAEEEAEGDDV